MLRTYLKIAFRNLWRHKASTGINVIGLTLGMVACFLIFLYVRFETSYDAFHTKADRIYRLVCDIKTSMGTRQGFVTSWPMGPAMKDEFPEVEAVIRLNIGTALIQKDQMKNFEGEYSQADAALFTAFDFPLIKGDPRIALQDPGSMVISETAARKYFGNDDPMGQHLEIENGRWISTITGIMKDIPENSMLKASMFFSTSPTVADLQRGQPGWGGFGNLTYVLLKPGADPRALEAKLPAFVDRHMSDVMSQRNERYTLSLEPLKKVYMHSFRGGYRETGSVNNAYIFSLIAVFILLIAGFNFINLTTAQAVERAKDIGIRKVNGAGRAQLIVQLIIESLVICAIAFFLAVVLIEMLLPLFNELSGKPISNHIFYPLTNVLTLFVLAVGIGLLAGVYPAFVLASLRPVIVLRGTFASTNKGIALRKALVISQFAISIILSVATIIIFSQLYYMNHYDLGFNIKRTILVDTHGDANQNALKRQVLKISAVQSATLSWGILGLYPYTVEVEKISGDMQAGEVGWRNVDFDFIKQYDLKMVAGRAFSTDFPLDSTRSLIVNEAAVKMFGYPLPEQIIGKRFVSPWGTGEIIGVVKDFHFTSLQEHVKPLCLSASSGCNLLSIKVDGTGLQPIIEAIKKEYSSLIPGWPFTYYFADDLFDKQYHAENRFGSLFFNFAILAIFISCLGLFGLASYSTSRRTKEVGIRKVLGASTLEIVSLLSGNFLRLVVLSAVIAFPVAWFGMKMWLSKFAYHVDIRWWMFAAGDSLAFFIAVATISLQVMKAASSNPVKSLRTE